MGVFDDIKDGLEGGAKIITHPIGEVGRTLKGAFNEDEEGDMGDSFNKAVIEYFEIKFKTIQDGQKIIARELEKIWQEIKELKEGK